MLYLCLAFSIPEVAVWSISSLQAVLQFLGGHVFGEARERAEYGVDMVRHGLVTPQRVIEPLATRWVEANFSDGLSRTRTNVRLDVR